MPLAKSLSFQAASHTRFYGQAFCYLHSNKGQDCLCLFPGNIYLLPCACKFLDVCVCVCVNDLQNFFDLNILITQVSLFHHILLPIKTVIKESLSDLI